MNRRRFVQQSITAAALGVFAASAKAQEKGGLQPLPKRDSLRVAFLLGDNAN